MFKIVKRESIDWPVTVQVPIDGGAVAPHVFQAKLKLLPQSQVRRLMNESAANGDSADLVREVLLGWQNVADEAGVALDFTPETRDALIDIPYVRIAIMNAFVEANNGQAAARKN